MKQYFYISLDATEKIDSGLIADTLATMQATGTYKVPPAYTDKGISFFSPEVYKLVHQHSYVGIISFGCSLGWALTKPSANDLECTKNVIDDFLPYVRNNKVMGYHLRDEAITIYKVVDNHLVVEEKSAEGLKIPYLRKVPQLHKVLEMLENE